jgi:transposase
MPIELSPDGLWKLIGPFISAAKASPKGTGPRLANFDRVCWVITLGSAEWSPLGNAPAGTGLADARMTCLRRLRDWQQAGVWQLIPSPR